MQIRPNAFTIGLIIYFSIALFSVYTEFGIDSVKKSERLIQAAPIYRFLSQFLNLQSFFRRAVTAEVYLTLGSKPAYMISVILFDHKRSLGWIILSCDTLHDFFTWKRFQNAYSSGIALKTESKA